MSVGAIVLAAGHGTRMRSRLPKVLHPIAGRPMILWALDALGGMPPAEVVVVLGPEGERVKPALPEGMRTALQEVRDGTGGATRIGLAALDPAVTTVVVMCGDTPLVNPDLVSTLVADHERSGRAATMVTAILPDGGSYGRVIRDHRGVRVVEARDADHDQLAVREINAGLFAFDRAALAVAACHEGPACFALVSSRFTVNPASPSVPTAMVAGWIPAAGVPAGLLPDHSTRKVMVRGVMALGDDGPHPATATTVMSTPAIAANGRATRADIDHIGSDSTGH